jgi:putative iron-dependent peroxidase
LCAEDSLADTLFEFALPVPASYFWCPPMLGGKLDLRVLGL